ncbi:NADH-ubiquinone oxidoreductase-F iron-sulfur binding region domain-containing protein [Actinomadura sp. 9N407]|uniref:NADH-ubiquinone oxidoreductase-F iron-sulfur binding region domain-containing protein n=1 Tax=Actinomadura sp. 9N407 TaxID=3375154 RepID=UPI0037B26EB9
MRFPLHVRPLGPARLLAAAPGGRAPRGPGPSGTEIIEIAGAAGIRGRGGAGFPLGAKLRSVADSAAPRRYAVANAEEGEPGSVKDRFLIRERPGLVVEGLSLAARAVGAERSYLYASDRIGADALEKAASPFPSLEVVRVEPAYVAGEETAVIRAIGGGPALPVVKPPRPWQEGLYGAPTLVSNAETLAQLALAVRLGPRAYRDAGTGDSPGTFLATVSGGGRPPVLYEVPYGVPLRELARAHLGDPAAVTGVLAGGLAGGLLPAARLGLSLTHAAFTAAGSTLGCGGFVLLTGECPVEVAAGAAAFFDRANARQCGPCVRGTEAVAGLLAELMSGTAGPAGAARLERMAGGLAGRGNCATPDAVSVLVGSLFRHHRSLVDAHTVRGCARCAAARPFDIRIPLGESS